MADARRLAVSERREVEGELEGEGRASWAASGLVGLGGGAGPGGADRGELVAKVVVGSASAAAVRAVSGRGRRLPRRG